MSTDASLCVMESTLFAFFLHWASGSGPWVRFTESTNETIIRIELCPNPLRIAFTEQTMRAVARNLRSSSRRAYSVNQVYQPGSRVIPCPKVDPSKAHPDLPEIQSELIAKHSNKSWTREGFLQPHAPVHVPLSVWPRGPEPCGGLSLYTGLAGCCVAGNACKSQAHGLCS